MHRGYVRDYRKGIEHPLFSRPLIWHFWVYCRLRANHKDTEIDFNGTLLMLKRGCFVMSIGSASKYTGLSVQNIRTCIKVLTSHKMIEKSTSQVTKQATIIKVIKFDTYQPLREDTNKASNKEPTRCQQGANKVPTTDNNVENVKNVDIKIIVDFLNQQLKTKYKPNSQKTKEKITARLNEGFTVDNFKTVIVKKNREWAGTDSAIYLRPETLFGTKFEGYLNQLDCKSQNNEKPKTYEEKQNGTT